MDQPAYYCVLDVDAGEIAYLGSSETGAVNALVGRRVYGLGSTKDQAVATAQEAADRVARWPRMLGKQGTKT